MRAAAFIMACGLLLGGAATAQSARGERMEAKLKAADTDGDGLISRAEAQRAFPKGAQRFDAIDTNRDGYLSRDEIAAFRAERAKNPTAGKP
jgi:Ca2+-binding EF-hand superfamily protein